MCLLHFRAKILLNRFAQIISLLELRLAFYIAHITVAAGQHMAKIVPAQVLGQVVIILPHIAKAIALGGHQKRRGAIVTAQQVALRIASDLSIYKKCR